MDRRGHAKLTHLDSQACCLHAAACSPTTNLDFTLCVGIYAQYDGVASIMGNSISHQLWIFHCSGTDDDSFDARFYRPVNITDFTNSAAELDIDIQLANFFDQLPVVGRILIKCRI